MDSPPAEGTALPEPAPATSGPPPSGLSTPRKSLVREYFEALVVAVVLALFVRTFVAQAFEIPTGSMENNLLVGDHLLVDKLAYAPSLGAFEDLLLARRPLARGQVVVFKFPEKPSMDFIKRVVALPGETVQVRGREVLVDGVALREDYVQFLDPRGDPHRGGAFWAADPVRDTWGPARVPPGHIFVLGDNRDNSRDSRFWGFLPLDQVKGRAWLVYWSHDNGPAAPGAGPLARLSGLAAALRRTRTERLFHLIR